MISEMRKTILKKNGREAVLIKLITIARVMGYESSEPVEEVAFKLGIEVIKRENLSNAKGLDKLKIVFSNLVEVNKNFQ